MALLVRNFEFLFKQKLKWGMDFPDKSSVPLPHLNTTLVCPLQYRDIKHFSPPFDI